MKRFSVRVRRRACLNILQMAVFTADGAGHRGVGWDSGGTVRCYGSAATDERVKDRAPIGVWRVHHDRVDWCAVLSKTMQRGAAVCSSVRTMRLYSALDIRWSPVCGGVTRQGRFVHNLPCHLRDYAGEGGP
jgi:hypothetical protein